MPTSCTLTSARQLEWGAHLTTNQELNLLELRLGFFKAPVKYLKLAFFFLLGAASFYLNLYVRRQMYYYS